MAFLPPSRLFLYPEWWDLSPELPGDRLLLSSLIYIWPIKSNGVQLYSQDWENGIKTGISALSFNSLFWKSHRELFGWCGWRRPVLSEAAGPRRRPPCTTTGCSSEQTGDIFKCAEAPVVMGCCASRVLTSTSFCIMSSGWRVRTSVCLAFSCARSLWTLQFTPVACGAVQRNLKNDLK